MLFRNLPLYRGLNRRKIQKVSNYENVENHEIAGCSIDTVGGSKHCIRWHAEGGESSPHKRPARVCIRVGHRVQDSAESENQPDRDTNA
jgi:hypothetical protein